MTPTYLVLGKGPLTNGRSVPKPEKSLRGPEGQLQRAPPRDRSWGWAESPWPDSFIVRFMRGGRKGVPWRRGRKKMIRKALKGPWWKDRTHCYLLPEPLQSALFSSSPWLYFEFPKSLGWHMAGLQTLSLLHAVWVCCFSDQIEWDSYTVETFRNLGKSFIFLHSWLNSTYIMQHKT